MRLSGDDRAVSPRNGHTNLCLDSSMPDGTGQRQTAADNARQRRWGGWPGSPFPELPLGTVG
jgi:hypothetical protein